jgi:predicted RND superfamily exporter protein
MLDTSIVLVAGMLVLTVSDFRGFLYLGGFTAWAIIAALVTDLLLLGPLLVALDDR